MFVAFSETIRFVSNRRNGEFKMFRMPANKVDKFYPDVIKEFTTILNRNIEKMNSFDEVCTDIESNSTVSIFNNNAASLNSVYTRSGQNSTPNSNATNLHSSQKRCCSFWISSSNASPTFQVQKSIFHQMTKPIQVTVILPLLLAISFSRNDDIHSSISGISNDLIGVISTIGQ